jgi:signal transduction histidine kinase
VRLINDILDIEKIEAGRMTFDVKPIPLDHIMRRAARDIAGFATEYGVRVDVDPPPAGAAVLADEDRLTQVITNLLSNAVKFSPADGAVRLSAKALDRRLQISVEDKGEGIPEAFRDIVREIVTRLGGSVSYDSRVGEGGCANGARARSRGRGSHLRIGSGGDLRGD